MREPVLKTSKVLQIAFIVSDVQAAAEKYARLFGIETPRVSMSDGYEKAQTVFMGKSSPARCKMAFIDLDNIQLEFIPASNEPSGCLQTFGDCREGQIPRCSAALQV